MMGVVTKWQLAEVYVLGPIVRVAEHRHGATPRGSSISNKQKTEISDVRTMSSGKSCAATSIVAASPAWVCRGLNHRPRIGRRGHGQGRQDATEAAKRAVAGSFPGTFAEGQ